MVIGIGIKTYYSIQHIQAAAYLARRATEVESNLLAEMSDEAVALKAYITSSLFSSVAFLEAQANEIFADALESNHSHLASLPARDRDMIATLGESESVGKASVLTKFDLILRGAGKEPIEKTCDPHQSTSTIIKLRNELIHYKAAFFDIGTEGMTRTGSFHTSKLPHQINGKYEPRKGVTGITADNWLSCGLSSWAVASVVAYADAVFSRLGVRPYFDHVRSALVTSKQPSDA